MASFSRAVVVLSALTLAFAPATTRPDGRFTGQVVGPGGQPLAGALVTFRRTGSIVSLTVGTNSEGRFETPDLRPGTYLVSGDLPGFEFQAFEADVVDGQAPRLDLKAVETADPLSGATSAAYLSALPDGNEKRRFILDCTGCHQFNRRTVMGPDDRTKPDSVWRSRIGQMIQYFGPQSGFPIISAYRDADETADWLVEHLGDAATGPFRPAPVRAPGTAAVITSYDFPRPQDLPHDLVVDPNGKVLVTGMFSHSMWLLDPNSETFEEFSIPLPQANPRALALADDGDWLVLLGQPKKIGRYDVAGSEWSFFDIPVYPHSIVYRAPAEVWYNGHFSSNPTIYESLDLGSSTRTPVEIDHPDFNEGSPIPYEIVGGLDGILWASELAGNRIIRIDARDRTSKAFDMPTPHSGPRRLDVGPDGTVWIPEYSGNALTRFDPATESFVRYPLPTRDALPYVARVHHATGTVWLAEAGADAIARFDPATETFVEFPLPDRMTLIRHIDVDQETGAVWAAYGHSPAASPKIVKLELVN